MDNFVHLEVQSAFSFLWGTFVPDELVSQVAALGQKAVALTDTGVHGVVRFYKAALSHGIQPIIGTKLRIWDGSPVVALASDLDGYGNICRLLSITLKGGVAQKNLISKGDLFNWNKGLICLVGLRGSRVYSSLESGLIDDAKLRLLEFKQILNGHDNLFVMIQNHGYGRNNEALKRMSLAAELAEDLRLPITASNEVTFLRPQDYILHRTLVGIQQNHHHRLIDHLPDDTFHLASGREMESRIPFPEAIENTSYIAELCGRFSLPIGKLHPPFLQSPEKAFFDLSQLCFKRAALLLNPVPAEYLRQLVHELSIINTQKLADFFLLVEKVIEFAAKSGIRHSIRGSAAGSLVVYLLLGGVDPLANNLLFERFINEGRSDLPDIDIDFDSEQRDEVIRYVMELLPDQTTMVSTVHFFKARSAVRQVARALGYPLKEIDKLATCLPWSLRGKDLKAALENLPELRTSELKHENLLVDLAAKMVGLPFQSSVHLGGVIVAPENVENWTPVGVSPNGIPVGQLDKDDVDALGLLKLDLLGLRMHTAIKKSLQLLESQGICLNLTLTSLNDPKTYSLLRSTDSLGVFQLESPGQRNLLGRLLPRRFNDLIAEISLFRPGPVEGNIVNPFVRRRNGKETVSIPHENLRPILSETYGVILFQEQVLKIVHTLSGLSYGEADAFRRAMTKDRKSHMMLLLKKRFIQGALKNGYSQDLVEEIFNQVAAFASYGFCKAHAASFAHITYQSAYLKAHFPQAFYLGLLNAGHVGSYPPHVILNEARRKGIKIYPPHVNVSGLEYSPEDGGIRVPLTVINGIGPEIAQKIVNERENEGHFSNCENFSVRVGLPEKIMCVLNLSGALDGLEPAKVFKQPCGLNGLDKRSFPVNKLKTDMDYDSSCFEMRQAYNG